MTTAAMVFGMLPTALKLGEGAETRAPMAIAVIGGLITSTLLTLVVIPVVYTIVDDLESYLATRGYVGHWQVLLSLLKRKRTSRSPADL